MKITDGGHSWVIQLIRPRPAVEAFSLPRVPSPPYPTLKPTSSGADGRPRTELQDNVLLGVIVLTSDKPPHADLTGVRVLIVEDQWHVASALKLLLEGEGMEVSGPAPTTAEALRLAAEQKPDLAIVDINLKGEMAYRLIDQLYDQGIRIVVASGYAVSPRDKVATILQKPFNGPELLAALGRTISF